MRKSPSTDFVECVASLSSGIDAWTALHYQSHLVHGETVLVLNAASVGGMAIDGLMDVSQRVRHVFNLEECGELGCSLR